MKIRKSLYIAGLCGAALFGGMFLGSASTQAEPGTPTDPIVTQSYVHRFVADAIAGLNVPTATAPAAPAESAVFTPIHVMAGHVLLGNEGTEIILRSGQAMANVPGTDGLTNLTIGADMAHGTSISANHLLVVPRRDGRGIWALSDAWMLVKGDFEIVAVN